MPPRLAILSVRLDTLSDLLAVTHLEGGVLSHSLCDPPWGLRYPAAGHVWFHIVASGACQLAPAKGPARALATQDLVLLPHGGGHVLRDAPSSKCIDVDLEWLRAQPGEPMVVSTGRRARGERTEILCGNYTVASASTHPALRSLPHVIHVPGRDVLARPRMHATMQELWRELAARDVGSRAVVSRLLEILFVEVLRYWLDIQPPGAASWLGALRDPPIGNALQLLLAAPERAWTVASLAREVGLSRAVFARRFAELVGTTPMTYLRGQRIERAAKQLLDTRASIAEVASAVGYTSEYAFNRAFRREMKIAPGRYRRRAER
jgi:AraC-like DNA-binding protein